jgi:hypothetical protein
MPGLVPGIYDFIPADAKSWMPATSAGMTGRGVAPAFYDLRLPPKPALSRTVPVFGRWDTEPA